MARRTDRDAGNPVRHTRGDNKKKPRKPVRRTRAAPVVKKITTASIDAIWQKIGSVRDAVQVLRQFVVEDKDIAALVDVYDALPLPEQNKLSLADLCEKTGYHPGLLIAVLARAMYEASQNISNMLVSLNEPGLVQASIENALHPVNGERERSRWLEARGRFATAKGAQINVNTNVNASAQANAAAIGLPSFEDDIMAGAELTRPVGERLINPAQQVIETTATEVHSEV